MEQDLQTRIEKMFKQDCMMAWIDVVLLWASVLFVLYFILDIVQDSGIRLVMYLSSFALLVFNTASVTAMTKHLNDDRQFIYGLDIQHLDANKAAKGQK